MSLLVLNAIKEKRATFPMVNKQAFFGQVPRIVKNLSEIKGRNFHKSIIYRQVNRDDYPQPSWIESFYCGWAATSFASQARGSALIAEVNSWEAWRRAFELTPSLRPLDFWAMESDITIKLAAVRRCHLDGEFYKERELLIEIRNKIDTMLSAPSVMPEVIR